jgi:hypothetical protein
MTRRNPEMAKEGDDVGPVTKNAPPRFDTAHFFSVGRWPGEKANGVLAVNARGSTEFIEDTGFFFT